MSDERDIHQIHAETRDMINGARREGLIDLSEWARQMAEATYLYRAAQQAECALGAAEALEASPALREKVAGILDNLDTDPCPDEETP